MGFDLVVTNGVIVRSFPNYFHHLCHFACRQVPSCTFREITPQLLSHSSMVVQGRSTKQSRFGMGPKNGSNVQQLN